MSDLFANDALLTVTQVRERVKEYRQWEAEIAALRSKMEEREKWFDLLGSLVGKDAVAALLGDLASRDRHKTEATTTRRVRGGQITWTAFIEEYVQSVNRPVDYSELRDAVSKSVLGPKLEASDKGFYGAILKLSNSGKVIKKGVLLFSPDSYADYQRKVAEGVIEEISEAKMTARPAPFEDRVKLFLDSCANGATGREVIDHMLTVPEFHESVRRNNTTVYNVLSRMVRRAQIRKIGQAYYSPDAPPNESSGSYEETAA